MTNETTTTAVASKKTLEERILDAKRLVAKLEAEKAARDLINNVSVDDVVKFKYGRAEKARVLQGTVVATKQTDQGLQLKVVVGEGFDAEDYKVFARDITENLTKASEPKAETQTEAAGAPLSDADPLSAA